MTTFWKYFDNISKICWQYFRKNEKRQSCVEAKKPKVTASISGSNKVNHHIMCGSLCMRWSQCEYWDNFGKKCSKTQKAFAKQLWCLWSQTRAPNITCICFFFFFFFRIFRYSSSVKEGRCKCKFLRPSARWALHFSPKTSEYQSGPRVVKMVLNTQCCLCLWLTMWFHAKKTKKHSRNQNHQFHYKIGSRAQIWPKIAQKTDNSIAICSIFFH